MDDLNKMKAQDEIYCPECGTVIKRSSVFCTECRTQLKEKKENIVEVTKPKEVALAPSKNKTIAILLSIFLGFWSWLYTYKVDRKKFWVYLCLILPGVVGIPIIINLSISGYVSNSAFVNVFLEGYGTWVWMYFLVNLSSFIWALVNSIARTESFYTNYLGIKIEDKDSQEGEESELDYQAPAKSRKIAIVLAAVLGFWSWLYTYKIDMKKFWTYLGIFIAESILVTILIVISETAIGFLANYGTWAWLFVLINLSGYIWALVGSIKRTKKFYFYYPQSNRSNIK